jgi:hypothetical protein
MGMGRRLQDAFKEKSQEISQSIGEKYRTHVGEELAQKEKDLRAREAALDAREQQLRSREKNLAAREAKLNRFYLLPKSYVLLPLVLLVLIGSIWAFREFTPALRPSGSLNQQSATTHAASSGSDCVSLGTAYYKGIGSDPMLSSGEDR